MRSQAGFTYLGVLLAVALLNLGLSAASEVWVATARHQRVEQLEWAGQQYLQAIGSYYESAPAGRKAYPRSLDDLLEDRRFVFKRRHLRALYANPFSGAEDWQVLLAPDGGISGVSAIVPANDSDAPARREYRYSPLAWRAVDRTSNVI